MSKVVTVAIFERTRPATPKARVSTVHQLDRGEVDCRSSNESIISVEHEGHEHGRLCFEVEI